MSEVAPIILAVTALLGALGAAGKFLWGKIERRFKAIDAKLAACEARERHSTRQNAVQLTVIELLWQETARLTPGKDSAVLKRASKLLGDLRAALPVESALPPEIAALVAQLDERD